VNLPNAADIPVDRLHTFCVVVPDVRATATNYARLLDMPNWAVCESAVSDANGTHRFLRATAPAPWGSDVTLIQPLDQSGTYFEFLQRHGNGIHSIVVKLTSDADFSANGCWLAQAGMALAGEETLGAEKRYLFDTREDLAGYLVGISIGDEGTSVGAESWDLSAHMDRPASVPGLGINALKHFGAVVPSTFRAASRHGQLWGLENWMVAEYRPEAGSLDTPRHNEKPSPHGFLTNMGFNFHNFGFELVQPTQGESDYQDTLDKHGPSIHHLELVWINDDAEFQKVLEWFSSIGIKSIQDSWMDGKQAVYYYLDTREQLGWAIEAYGAWIDWSKAQPQMNINYSTPGLANVKIGTIRARQPVRAVVQIEVPEEAAEGFRSEMLQYGMGGGKDAGCLQYEMFQSATSPGRFALLELWNDPQTYEEHWALEVERWKKNGMDTIGPAGIAPEKEGLVGTEFYPMQGYEMAWGRWAPRRFSRKS